MRRGSCSPRQDPPPPLGRPKFSRPWSQTMVWASFKGFLLLKDREQTSLRFGLRQGGPKEGGRGRPCDLVNCVRFHALKLCKSSHADCMRRHLSILLVLQCFGLPWWRWVANLCAYEGECATPPTRSMRHAFASLLSLRSRLRTGHALRLVVQGTRARAAGASCQTTEAQDQRPQLGHMGKGSSVSKHHVHQSLWHYHDVGVKRSAVSFVDTRHWRQDEKWEKSYGAQLQ